MNFATVENGIVVNLIVCTLEVSTELGALPTYDGCAIGQPYSPPYIPTDIELTQQDITDLQLYDIEQGQRMTDLEIMVLGGADSV